MLMFLTLPFSVHKAIAGTDFYQKDLKGEEKKVVKYLESIRRIRVRLDLIYGGKLGILFVKLKRGLVMEEVNFA
jgi:hypothetical protein